jgi:uncharacterized protein
MPSLIAQREPRRLAWLSGGAAVGVLAALIVAPQFGAPLARAADVSQTPEHTISVSGTGKVLLAPDVADISFGVSVRKDRAKDSTQAAAVLMSKVVDALKAAGIADKDIQTSNISLQPVYDYSGNNPVLVGYETDNTVSVTVRDLTKVGQTIDDAVAAGANNVSGITFRVDDPSQAESQARTQAMNDAKSKADALASAGGVTITGIQSISEVSAPPPMPIDFNARAAAAGDATTTPIQPGNVSVEVTVNVNYLISN